MYIYPFQPKKNNTPLYAFIVSLIGLIFIFTQVGLIISIFAICFYIIVCIICIKESINIRNSRFELCNNKLNHYIKNKLVKSFDLSSDRININKFDHGRVLSIKQNKKSFDFHENNIGSENFDKLVYAITGNPQEKKFTDFTKQ